MGGEFRLWSMASIAAKGWEPLRDWIYLSLFLRSLILPFHRFLNSRRSVTPIGLNFGHDLYPYISFLAAKEGHQPPYGVAMRVRGVPRGWGAPPCLVPPSGTVSRGFSFPYSPNILKIISIRFYPVWTPFDMDILQNQKHAIDRKWHWALDQ